MKSVIWFVSFVSIATLSVVMTLQPHAEAGTYKWTDAQGNVHFTDDVSRIPPSEREAVEVIHLPESTSSDDTATPPLDSDTPTSSSSPPEIDGEDVMATPVGPDTKCLENIREERERLETQLAEDQERLAWVIKKRRYPTVRKNNLLKEERSSLEARIAETQKKLSQELPQREMACGG